MCPYCFKATNDFLLTVGTRKRPTIHRVFAIASPLLSAEFVAMEQKMAAYELRRGKSAPIIGKSTPALVSALIV